MTEEEFQTFISKDASKQLHMCCLKYCSRNHIMVYKGKKMAKEYFQCRAYLKKLPVQTMKNIYMFLDSHTSPCNLYDLERIAKEYVSQEQTKHEKKAVEAVIDKREYDIDVEDFLNS